jgi:hypothetical protein
VRIWKYPLKITDEQDVLIPRRYRARSVGLQDGGAQLVMWVHVDESFERIPVRVYVVGTGNPANVPLTTRFIGTVQMPNGFVWHVFVEEASL